MSERSRLRAERIQEEIDISQVLIDFGYNVHPGAEHQFSCDLHGDGFDSKPSARVYPESSSWYCWACEKSRDAIETVRAKQGIGFMEAMKWLEDRYGLDTLPWTDQQREEMRKVEKANPFEETYRRARSYDEEREDTKRFLDDLTYDRDLPYEQLLAFWEAFDMIQYKLRKGWAEELASKTMSRLLLQMKKRVGIEVGDDAV